MRSAYPPERLEIELQSRVGPPLSERGYRLVGYGPAGVTWRRRLSARVTVGMVLLGLLALGGLASGDVGSTLVGLACGAGLAYLIHARRPASVTIDLTRVPGGTELAISGGPDAKRAAEIARAVAGLPPAQISARPEAPSSLWRPPNDGSER